MTNLVGEPKTNGGVENAGSKNNNKNNEGENKMKDIEVSFGGGDPYADFLKEWRKIGTVEEVEAVNVIGDHADHVELDDNTDIYKDCNCLRWEGADGTLYKAELNGGSLFYHEPKFEDIEQYYFVMYFDGEKDSVYLAQMKITDGVVYEHIIPMGENEINNICKEAYSEELRRLVAIWLPIYCKENDIVPDVDVWGIDGVEDVFNSYVETYDFRDWFTELSLSEALNIDFEYDHDFSFEHQELKQLFAEHFEMEA